jgi:hypothetical protein
MLTPDLDCCASVLWTMHWLDCVDLYVLVIPKLSRISNIFECTVQRDHEGDICSFLLGKHWTVIALDASGNTFKFVTLKEIMLVCSWCAWNVRASNSNIAELAVWLWVLLLELGEWSTMHNDFGVSTAWSLSWIYIFNLNSRLSALKEFFFGSLISSFLFIFL